MLAQVDGLVALRLANADVVPYDVKRYATDTRVHVQTLLDVAEARAVDVDLTRLVEATTELEDAADRFVIARDHSLEGDAGLSLFQSHRGLIAFSGNSKKAWLDDDGLQDRPWSRNLYVSPDPFSGYAFVDAPGVRYEIETDDPDEVPQWEERYLRAITRLTDYLEQATAELTR